MKISKQDEYGLRVLLRIARAKEKQGLSIPQLSELEGLSHPYVGKITRALRLSGLIKSTRGQKGGYILARAAAKISIKEAIDALGGQLFYNGFCGSHAGQLKLCTNSVDCSVRSLWKVLQYAVDRLFENIMLQDLIGEEEDAAHALEKQLDRVFLPLKVLTQNASQTQNA
ncbi:MAG: Rrf2 family transcriptional regulator [Bacteroidota bacterium]